MFHAFHSLLLLEKNDFPANKEKALQTLIIRCYNKSTFRADYKKGSTILILPFTLSN